MYAVDVDGSEGQIEQGAHRDTRTPRRYGPGVVSVSVVLVRWIVF